MTCKNWRPNHTDGGSCVVRGWKDYEGFWDFQGCRRVDSSSVSDSAGCRLKRFWGRALFYAAQESQESLWQDGLARAFAQEDDDDHQRQGRSKPKTRSAQLTTPPGP